MAGWKVTGSFDRTRKFLKRMSDQNLFRKLESLGQEGVAALQAYTPKDSGVTAASWTYDVVNEEGLVRIVWSNTNTNNGFNIAVGLQYGHGTGTGGYVVGRDYINPAIRPIFDRIANDIWKAVTSA